MVLRVGCVPEHFSAPLMYATQNGQDPGEEIELVMCKLGTGDMVKRVVAGELDVAICVTEGLVAGIGNNRESGLKLFGTYVDSPLPWAVSVKADSELCTVDDLAFGATFGISRPGSGSEVMARYASSQYEWAGPPKFAVLGDVHGLIRGVQDGRADAFLWERTTMQRHYTQGAVRYLGTVRPPWPAFSYAALSPFIGAHGARLRRLQQWAGAAAARFMGEIGEQQRAAFVCQALGYAAEDVAAWAAYVQFSGDGAVDTARIGKAVAALERAGVVAGLGPADVVMTPGA
ncbi:hypothetical protein LPJ70_001027 [Coemansia sp. RSA 2708]|nr:hypothetical protein LPJ70_001027 [Coemansia sp. RSA 2708]